MKITRRSASSPSTSIPASSNEAASEPNMVFAWKVAACLGAGLVFGFVAEKGRVSVPEAIRKQMLMSQFTMLKVFLSAVVAGVTGFVVIAVFPLTRDHLKEVRNTFRNCVKSKHISVFAAGGAILGMGMTLCGSCPGMVLLQVGNGTQHALFTLAGCFIGTLLYGVVDPFITAFLTLKQPRTSHDAWLHHSLGLPYTSVAVVFALLLGGVVGVVEYLVPWQTEVPVSSSSTGLLQQTSWSPIWAGLLMGCMQFPVLFAVGDSLGSSSSYCTAISMATRAAGADRSLPYFTCFYRGIGNWWQVAYWLGAASGAGLSAYLSSSWGDNTNSGAAWMSLVGGALMLFGSRLASGCTSGHGLSGMALLATTSFVTVPAMFAGGIGLAAVMKT